MFFFIVSIDLANRKKTNLERPITGLTSKRINGKKEISISIGISNILEILNWFFSCSINIKIGIRFPIKCDKSEWIHGEIKGILNDKSVSPVIIIASQTALYEEIQRKDINRILNMLSLKWFVIVLSIGTNIATHYVLKKSWYIDWKL